MTDEMKEVAELFTAQRVIGRQAALIDLISDKLNCAAEHTENEEAHEAVTAARNLIASYKLLGD